MAKEAIVFVQSESMDKALAMQRALPGHRVIPIAPVYDEQEIKKSVRSDADRHIHIATAKDAETQKALQDIGGAIGGVLFAMHQHAEAYQRESYSLNEVLIMDTSDTVRLIPAQDKCLEKPDSPHEWWDQILTQRGQQVAIASHHILRNMEDTTQEPVTLTVMSSFQVKDFTREEIERSVIEFARTQLAGGIPISSDSAALEMGIGFMSHFAGSLPIDHMKHFFEPDPIVVTTRLVNGRVTEGSFEIPDWQQLTREDLATIFTGAFTPPMAEAVGILETGNLYTHH